MVVPGSRDNDNNAMGTGSAARNAASADNVSIEGSVVGSVAGSSGHSSSGNGSSGTGELGSTGAYEF
jgi:hypothetical protein